MSQDHTLMASRFELKYIIPEEKALRVRDFIQQYLELDEFGVGKPNLSYPVQSLDLDSESWSIYHRTINGDKNRWKLRLRYYNENPKTPIFFEVKRRMKEVILKQRCAVRRSAVPLILAGHLPEPDHLFSHNAEELVAIQHFLELMITENAKPKMHIAYDREAYVNRFNNEVRVTIDRNVRAVPRFEGTLPLAMEDP